jgi:hypothetical protein
MIMANLTDGEREILNGLQRDAMAPCRSEDCCRCGKAITPENGQGQGGYDGPNGTTCADCAADEQDALATIARANGWII